MATLWRCGALCIAANDEIDYVYCCARPNRVNVSTARSLAATIKKSQAKLCKTQKAPQEQTESVDAIAPQLASSHKTINNIHHHYYS